MKNKIRPIFQAIFLGLILYVAARPIFDKAYIADFERYCPFGGISSFFSKLNNGSMACNMSETQVFLGLVLLVGAGFIGKLFCSYVCPIGSVTEWIGKLGEKLKIRKELPKSLDRYFRVLKYALLFITVYFTMTESELFCKTYDPYFATVNLFNNADLILFYAIPAFIITVGGALLFRLFWCKYLCPLGAMTNIFMNLAFVIPVVVLFFVANYFGAGLSYVWLLGGLVLVGLINEIGFMKSFWLPIPKVKRSDTCSNCGFCDSKCPQGIDVSAEPVVKHIDCNLCTDCVYSCPKKNVLTINKSSKLKYIAPIMVVVLIALSFGVANYFEFKTISERWGVPKGEEAVYIQEGLKSVKCYGSAMALAGALKSIEGIHGLDAYAKTHKINIFYDPTVISESEIKANLFTPAKIKINEPKYFMGPCIGVYDIGIYGFFDQIDYDNLKHVLSGNKGVYGFETHYGEPVHTTIYYDTTLTSPELIRKSIESDHVVVKSESGEEEIEINFKPQNAGIIKPKISAKEYQSRMFNSYSDIFNGYESYKLAELSVLEFKMPQATDPKLRKYMDYLVSHLSVDPGIVRFATDFKDAAYGYLYFDPKLTTLDKVKAALSAKKLKYYITETETEEIDNPFNILPEGKLYKANEIDI